MLFDIDVHTPTASWDTDFRSNVDSKLRRREYMPSLRVSIKFHDIALETAEKMNFPIQQ